MKRKRHRLVGSGEEEHFCKPNMDKTRGLKVGNYSKLNNDGFVDKDTYVTEDDILIGKGIKNNSNYNYRDNSTTLRKNENGFVDDDHITTNSDF